MQSTQPGNNQQQPQQQQQHQQPPQAAMHAHLNQAQIAPVPAAAPPVVAIQVQNAAAQNLLPTLRPLEKLKKHLDIKNLVALAASQKKDSEI